MKGVAKDRGHESMLVFSIEVSGEVNERQIFGAVYNHTEIVNGAGLESLQRSGQVGKCILENGGGRWTLKIPFTMPLHIAALLAASIESIDSVNGSSASFKLVALVQRRDRMLSIAKRAKELMAEMEDKEQAIHS